MILLSMTSEPFIGSEALTAGLVRKHELRAHYRRVFPDVYVDADARLTIGERARAAWLWSHREAVLAGRAASALHGSKWVADGVPVELIWPNNRRPVGIVTWDDEVCGDEVSRYGDMRITTPPRTAYDIGRRGQLDAAVAQLDALGNATGFTAVSVLDIASRHPGSRGVRQLRTALGLCDPGAESPRETSLRLLLIRAGLPRPRTQIPVLRLDGRRKYYLDMRWEDIKLAVEYDGDHHRTDPVRYAYDIRRMEELTALDWTVVRVIKSDSHSEILRRVEQAWSSKLR